MGNVQEPDEQLGAVLDLVTSRRFRILQACVALKRPFTVKELIAALPSPEPSLPRDLNALEQAGLLVVDPPISQPRQGRPRTYTVAGTTRSVYRRIYELLDSAY